MSIVDVRGAAAHLKSAGPVLLADPDIVYQQGLMAGKPVLQQLVADEAPTRNNLSRPFGGVHDVLHQFFARWRALS